MCEYTDRNDRSGLDYRLMVLASREARARYLAVSEEAELGAITLYMSKHDIQTRLREALYTRGVRVCF
jgi:hypothetical protein